MVKLTYNDLYDVIDSAYDNEYNISIYVLGSVVKDLIDYLECELGCNEYEGFEYENIIDDGKVYSLDLFFNDALYYSLDEAYYNGKLLKCSKEDFQIAYIDNACELTQLENIDTDKFFFDLVNDEECKEEADYQQLCPNAPCEKCGECFDIYKENNKKEYFISVEYSNINGKKTYKVNGKETTKEEYDKTSEEISFDDTFSRFDSCIRNRRNVFRLM